MIISRSTHFAANGIISFFFMAELYSIICLCVCVCVCVICDHIFFIHSSVLAIVNSAAVYTEVRVSFQIMVFSGCMPSGGIAGSYGSPTVNFLRTLHTVLRMVVSIYLPTKSVGEFPFLHTPSSIHCLWIL